VTPHAIVGALGIYAGVFVVGAISSMIPIVSIDLFLIGLTVASAANPVPVIILAAAGQLAGKLPIYWASRGVATLRGPHRERLERLRARVARWQRAPLLVLATSAVSGLPPFSIMATAAGLLAIRLRAFCAVVFLGRATRFAIVIAATALASR
jgi:membrane protein YqaA with SNARE-associated domain